MSIADDWFKEHEEARAKLFARLVEFLKLYEKIYMTTQTHPTVMEEASVIVKAKVLLSEIGEK